MWSCVTEGCACAVWEAMWPASQSSPQPHVCIPLFTRVSGRWKSWRRMQAQKWILSERGTGDAPAFRLALARALQWLMLHPLHAGPRPSPLQTATHISVPCSIDWLGGPSAFPEWTLGTIAQFWGNGEHNPIVTHVQQHTQAVLDERT